MTEAVFGLLGVIIGGLLTAMVQVVQERRAERVLGRAAARLLSAELSVQQELLMRWAADDSAVAVGAELPPVVDWPVQRAVMARSLDEPKWRAVAAAYAKLVIWHADLPRRVAAADVRRTDMAALADELEAARYELQQFRSGHARHRSAGDRQPTGG
jgi:hypothetical protein